MAKIDVVDAKGKKTTTTDLDDAVFAIVPNGAVLHQVVTAQLAARRAGTQSTKTRAEVAGGGVALGPKPRSYAHRTPKKMVRLALRSALSDRSSDDKVKVVDFGWDAPKTAQAVAALADLGIEGKVLLVLKPDDHATWKSFRNLGDVHILTPSELNAYDVLVSDWVVFTPGTVPADTPLSRGGHGKAKAPEGVASETAATRGGAPGERDEVPTVPADAVEAPEPSADHVEVPVPDSGSEEE